MMQKNVRANDAVVTPAKVAGDQRAAMISEMSDISGRLERLPFGRWHARWMLGAGAAHLFDAFDALAITFVLPALVIEWQLNSFQAGMILSGGAIGQGIGAIALGAAAERYGRVRVIRWCLVVISLFSILSASASGFALFVVLRFLQSVGLGGELPVGATYINEMCPTKVRGSIGLGLQSIFAVGSLVTAVIATWMIPRYGWQSVFLVGGIPILLAIALPRLVPESPRWLSAQGREAEADAILSQIERRVVAAGRKLPPVDDAKPIRSSKVDVNFGNLLSTGYTTRSLSTWLIAFCVSVSGYGIISWMPTLYITVYKLSLTDALRYGLGTNIAGVAGILIAAMLLDRIGRRTCFLIGFASACPLLFYLAYAGGAASVAVVMVLSSLGFAVLTLILGGLYVYAPEIYPTHMRAMGTGAMSAWLRIGSVIGPLLVGYLLPVAGVEAVFVLFAVSALIGLLIVFFFTIETKGRALDDIST